MGGISCELTVHDLVNQQSQHWELKSCGYSGSHTHTNWWT